MAALPALWRDGGAGREGNGVQPAAMTEGRRAVGSDALLPDGRAPEAPVRFRRVVRTAAEADDPFAVYVPAVGQKACATVRVRTLSTMAGTVAEIPAAVIEVHDVCFDDDVGVLKARIEELEGVLVEDQRLFFNGRELLDGAPIAYYKLPITRAPFNAVDLLDMSRRTAVRRTTGGAGEATYVDP